MSAIETRRDGSINSTHPNGDRVRLRISRFHGLLVTASREYVDSGRKEATAYFGDPQAVADWLASEGYVASGGAA